MTGYHKNLQPRFEFFFDRVEIGENGCWVWIGADNGCGYGAMSDHGTVGAHRWSYEKFIGPIPPGMHLDHLCHTRDRSCSGRHCLHRRCVNPDHLEPVTTGENIRRGRRLGPQMEQTACHRGHLFTPENTYWQGNKRSCIVCRREESLRSWHIRQARLKQLADGVDPGYEQGYIDGWNAARARIPLDDEVLVREVTS